MERFTTISLELVDGRDEMRSKYWSKVEERLSASDTCKKGIHLV